MTSLRSSTRYVILSLLALGMAFAGLHATAYEAPSGMRKMFGQNAEMIGVNELNPEARHVLALIKQGGPFPYSRDGVVFGNREKRLPKQPRGYYKEYTVKTPGARNRGARRIIAGSKGEFYYTDDHYETFRQIKE
ncbi:MAG: ribonuclease domain-containing protein [Burkholderiales bacterium]